MMGMVLEMYSKALPLIRFFFYPIGDTPFMNLMPCMVLLKQRSSIIFINQLKQGL